MTSMEYIPVTMVRHDLHNLPEVALRKGFRWRRFCDGDQFTWAELKAAASEFSSATKALAHFEKEFSPHLEAMGDRCFFLCDATGQAVGTATAWYGGDFDPFAEGNWGRIHWVSVHPDYRGLGLGKALVAKALQRLAESHPHAYLTTQTTSQTAIWIYLNYAFRPFIHRTDCEKAWRLLAHALKHPALAGYR